MKRWRRGWSLLLAVLLALLAGMAALAEPAAEEAPVAELPEFDLTEIEPEAEVVADPVPEAGAMPGESSDVVDAPPEDGDAAVAAPAQGDPLRMNATEVTLGVGETFELKPVLPDGTANITFAYTTSSAKIAPVSAAGVITAKKKGTATVTATASTGEQFTCKVAVVKAPKKITLSATSGKLAFDAASGIGTQYRLGVSFPKGTGCRVTFSGYDANVLTVSEDGVLTARGLGETTVTASTFNGKKASCKVTVVPAPDTIAFADAAPAMIEKEKRTLALATAPEGSIAGATFASDNAAVATVNAETGEVTALSMGEANITATSFNGKTASCKVTVLAGPDKIALPADTVLLGLGDQALLGATPVRNDGAPTGTGLTYSSSKTKVVTVAADGTLTGKKKGTAKVTVSAANGVKATCTVKVVKAPSSVKLSIDRRYLKFDAAQGVADQAHLRVTLTKNTASSIVYSGYDPAVVTVATDGTVTATGVGSTTITATTFNGKKASCKINVRAPGDAVNRNVVNVAHRGGMGSWTENTLEAFRNTAASGATAVELDARSTRDGVQVVHHDATFTAGGKKYTIKKVKFDQLRQLDANICTLDEALDVLAGTGLEINLELKDTANPSACVSAVKSHGLQGRTMYISFNQKLLKQVRALDGSAPIGYIINDTPGSLAKTLSSLKAGYVFQKKDYLTPDNLFAWQDAGYKVGVWTVNDAAAIKNWLEMGVDYITSDYPARVTEALK